MDSIKNLIYKYDDFICWQTITLVLFTFFICYLTYKYLKRQKKCENDSSSKGKCPWKHGVNGVNEEKEPVPTNFDELSFSLGNKCLHLNKNAEILSKEERENEMNCQKQQMELIFKLLKEAEAKEDKKIYTQKTKASTLKATTTNTQLPQDDEIKTLMEAQMRLYGIQN